MTSPDLLTEWSRLLLGSLRRAGLQDVVISPGSRSTPFTWAALNEPDLRCRTIVDERSAGFFALGHARMTGDAVLLICTSGSAAANYFPAIVEAAEAAVPLLVLTADRPLELQGAAAPQTIDQVKLYGDHVRAYIELGAPDGHPRMLRALPRLAAQALATTRGPLPGPVHLNARARKPLEPSRSEDAASRELRDRVDGLLERLPSIHVLGGDLATADTDPGAAADWPLRRACASARRGLIVCGPVPPAEGDALRDAAGRLARATGFPLVAEWASQCRALAAEGLTVLDAYEALLDSEPFRRRHRPDLILQIGRPPTASSWSRALEEWADVERWVIAPHGWPDPSATASAVVRAPFSAAVDALIGAGAAVPTADGPGSPDESERQAWREALGSTNRVAREVIDRATATGFPEGAAVRAVADALAPDAVLAVGNSLPIREVDLFVPADGRGMTVWSQRGANGIDGLVSGSAGAAAASGRPVTLLIGDVSFLHDIGGLAALRDLPAAVTIVVLNNGGGRIFERLPLIDAVPGEADQDVWLTPPRLDIAAAAAAFGLGYGRATDVESLRAALADLKSAGGIVEVVVPEGGTTEHQRELRRRLERAVAE